MWKMYGKEKTIYCCYEGYLTVPNDFDCGYCDECDFCPDNSYTYYEETLEEKE